MPGARGEGHAAGHSRRRRFPRGARAACNSSAYKNSPAASLAVRAFQECSSSSIPFPNLRGNTPQLREAPFREAASELAKLRGRGAVAIKIFAGVKDIQELSRPQSNLLFGSNLGIHMWTENKPWEDMRVKSKCGDISAYHSSHRLRMTIGGGRIEETSRRPRKSRCMSENPA